MTEIRCQAAHQGKGVHSYGKGYGIYRLLTRWSNWFGKQLVRLYPLCITNCLEVWLSMLAIRIVNLMVIIIKSLLAKDVSHPRYGHVISHPGYGHVIQDVLFISSNFLVCNSTHVKHLGNSVAHFLAKRAKLGNELQVWFESIPDDIAPLF